MAISFYARNISGRLVPSGEADADELDRIPSLKLVKVSIVQERSAKRNRFFHALCKKIADAMEAMGADYADKAWVTDEIKVAVGHYQLVRLSRWECRRLGIEFGAEIKRAKSIDFDKMDEFEFSQFVTRVVGFTLTQLLPHMPSNQFTVEVERILDDDARAAWVEHRRKTR